MSRSLKLQVSSPCDEDWNKFGKTEKGGFCESCSKEVIDFSKLSDGEIRAYFRSSNAFRVCGRFNLTQLNRNIDPVPASNSPFLKAASMAIGLAAYFSSVTAKAQIDIIKMPYSVSPDTTFSSITGGAIVAKEPEASSVSGIVVDGETNETLPGVQVSIKNSKLGTVTNGEGYYSLALDSNVSSEQTTLVFSFIGYDTKEISAKSLTADEGKLKLQLSPALLGKTIVVGGAFRQSNFIERVWWRLRRLFN